MDGPLYRMPEARYLPISERGYQKRKSHINNEANVQQEKDIYRILSYAQRFFRTLPTGLSINNEEPDVVSKD